MKMLKKLLAIAAVAGLVPMQAQAAPIMVDLQLVLAVDISGSVDANEFALQRDGYVNAFQSAAVQNAITSTAGGSLGRIAVSYVYWASSATQTIGWTLIDSAESANTFANAISAAARPTTIGGLTGIGNAINFSSGLFGQTVGGELLFTSARQIIDISGDGTSNTGASVTVERDTFINGAPEDVSRAINGVAIGGGDALLTYYENNVIGGTDSFALLAASFSDFEDAISDKLLAEIQPDPQPVPEPATLALLGLGLAGLGALRRRKQQA